MELLQEEYKSCTKNFNGIIARRIEKLYKNFNGIIARRIEKLYKKL